MNWHAATRLHAGPRTTNFDQAPVFVVGMPRSGTTLVEQIIASRPAVHGAGERPELARTFARIGNGDSPGSVRSIAALDAGTLDIEATRFLRDPYATAKDAKRVIDTMPGNYRYLGLTALMLPGARAISCERDPRDIGLSIFTFCFYELHAYEHDLADLGWIIAQQRCLIEHWHEALPNLLMTVKVIDVVDDFAGTLRRVLDFLDFPYEPACETFYEVDRSVRTVSRHQLRQPINARGVGRWREYERPLAPPISALHEYDALNNELYNP